MRKMKLVSTLVLGLAAISGLAVASTGAKPSAAASQGYICPITGEELPCPACCPANDKR